MKPWTITLGNRSWSDEDATVAHLGVLASELGLGGWDHLSPWSSPVALAGWIVVLEASTSGRPLADVMAQVYALRVSDLGNCLGERE